MRFVSKEGDEMLCWASIFLVIALAAALFEFTGITIAAAGSPNCCSSSPW